MKKVVNITIGGVVFNVEEDAYKSLSKYLDGIGEYFKKDDDREEIIADIEVSIAEKFGAGRKAENYAVTLTDVQKVIEAMGSTKDFKEFAEDDSVDDSEVVGPARKLYRDLDDKIVGGVASGLAAYLGIEVVIVRLLFFVSFLLGGIGFILYVFLWIVVEPAQTTAQKLHMRGEKITLKEIEKSVKTGVENLKKKDLSKFGAAFDKFFRGVGAVVMPVLKFLHVVIGIALIIAAISGVLALSFGIAWMLSGAGIPYVDFVLRDFLVVSDMVFGLFNAALYCVVFVPFVMFFVLGVAMLKKKYVISGGMLVVLLTLWFASVGFMGSVFFQNIEHIQEKVEEIEGMDFVRIDF